jgi:hypothetical protein
VLTELSPAHHPHQTGLYWGLTRVNGRDFFRQRGGDHWRRVELRAVTAAADEVAWLTVYDLLGADGSALLARRNAGHCANPPAGICSKLSWTAEALVDVTVGEYNYGGLFLRMPWREGRTAQVIDSNRQRDERADQQRAILGRCGPAD